MNYRIYVEKKNGFDVEAKGLFGELREGLGLKGLSNVRILNCYDLFNINEDELEKAKKLVFAEAPTDLIYDEVELKEGRYFAAEYLPGQFDQRADSAMQCLNLVSDANSEVVVTSGKLIILEGEVADTDLERIKKFYINPVEMREKDLAKLQVESIEAPKEVPVLEGFTDLTEDEMESFRGAEGLAMTVADLLHVQKYFRDTEDRDPTETEIKVLDTYWSDHCRHTTFETKLTNIILPKGRFEEVLQETFDEYLKSREVVHGERLEKKYISLMDMATISGKELKKTGRLDDLEISEEINACSVYIDVDVDGETEKWLLMFKNETHNHPTEIEPFGGASTCLGGAIRDPLSGRSYVYQAIRVTGAANPLEKLEDTIPGKLPQKKITREAAHGYASYGNQIGLTTGHVAEIYHEGYKAKRMEVGAVVGAVPAEWVRRESPAAGDIVILLGGKTGRDGCGGATGSSKEHTDDSLATCGAEVQKGNAPEERKIQKLFRKPEVTKLIKKCNDFGAGGVSVAIGELAPGLEVNLDVVPTKYAGLNGTELAISESQERMAVVIEAKDREKFIALAEQENLLATEVAEVTDRNRLEILWRGQRVVDLCRDFLDTNGVMGENEVEVEEPVGTSPLEKELFTESDNRWLDMMGSLNVASQKGLMEMFDSSIGATTVLMPFGGKYQMTPTDLSIQKLPLLKGETDTASAISWGFDPDLSSWSPFHGGAYAVVESLAKIVAAGGDYRKIRMSFQEYFRKLGNDPVNWGKPFSALLGTLFAQKQFELAAIGGKDSMSGTFNELHVPPTLISFAVAPVKASEVVSPELKGSGNRIYLVKHNMREDLMPNVEELKSTFEFIHENIKNGKIISASTIKKGGIAETIAKMTLGNRIGVKITSDEELFKLSYGSFVVETAGEFTGGNLILLGETTEEAKIVAGDTVVDLGEMEKIWLGKLDTIFPHTIKNENEEYEFAGYHTEKVVAPREAIETPRVFVPAFPGTNCEYDSMRAFEKAGAEAVTMTFRNQSQKDIDDSIEEMVANISQSQILMFPGGFSAGDEPDGSGKFIATVLNNPKVAEAINEFLKRDGLILGICNGFQALIKSGLLPYGRVGTVGEDSPTLTFNSIGRHISQMVTTKVVSNKSPWLNGIELGSEHQIAVSHGEGRFVASPEVVEELFKNGQVATQYVNFDGKPTTEFRHNPNGSVMAIEGITSLDGRILGKMGHSERVGENLYKNIIGEKEQKIFENGVRYFTGK
ncbi:phosphoribosylformylglycinamidine synthase [Propionigenium maris DSM 9537]|uniref:Phosphoribosylformylglycinamidine synthase n=1 Tax=Propionigenium maris DSM 9537 TaxID=1123000 RepID=A0A9W6GN12_9FUSO|nr:phosphoribosylformylglycinamidine synthase [Propionigenium maris]GLI56819.1 phosphoribosylformylglycinamidine synthase [Propionigenium maris DSM 9537]